MQLPTNLKDSCNVVNIYVKKTGNKNHLQDFIVEARNKYLIELMSNERKEAKYNLLEVYLDASCIHKNWYKFMDLV